MATDPAHKLSNHQLAQIYMHHFGGSFLPTAVSELTGGTVNETWLLDLRGSGKVVLRIAPAQTTKPFGMRLF